MSSSFISERSAELVLVPELIKQLYPFYPSVTPIYFWTSREGGIISRDSFSGILLRMLVFYARRPKVTAPGSGGILIKLNQILYDRATFLNRFGIPVIAGFPLADSLQCMHLGVSCAWLFVNPGGTENYLDVLKQDQEWDLSRFAFAASYEIAQAISRSPKRSWEETIEIIQEMRRSSTSEAKYYHRFMGGDPYKPIYLLVHST